MLDSVCKCIYSHYIDEPVTVLSTVLDFLFSIIVISFGLLLNYRFKKTLEEEKKAVLLGRKGNVIEPIMRWYLNFSLVYWPYEMLFLWIMAHEIMPADWFSNCWVMNILMNPLRIGRAIIAYNSFFVALIRYLYIVHRKKANEWKFRSVGSIFQGASIVVPLTMELVRFLSEYDLPGLRSTDRFKSCVAINEGLNVTANISLPDPMPVELSLKVFPGEVVDTMYYFYITMATIVYSNVIEGYFYFKMFRVINRYDHNYKKLQNINFKIKQC